MEHAKGPKMNGDHMRRLCAGERAGERPLPTDVDVTMHTSKHERGIMLPSAAHCDER